MASRQSFIVAAKRTAFGAFGGSLKQFTATELGAFATQAALTDISKDSAAVTQLKQDVDSVIFGNVIQSSKDASYLARHVGLKSGAPITSHANTINRLCGSGFQAVIQAAHEIAVGDANVVIAGGSESMSQSPYVLRNARWGIRYGLDSPLEDVLFHTLVDQGHQSTATPMGITAENLANDFKISREECDQFAVQSQHRWQAAHDAGVFDREIVDVQVPASKRNQPPLSFKVDEHARGKKTTLEALAALKPSFGGVTTAGNASGINDGAAALIVVSGEYLRQHSWLKPLARIVTWQVSGVDPTRMGIGPVPAIQGVLKRAKLNLSDIERIEVNEAFAAQFLAVQKALQLPLDRTNIHGGAIAIGHPLAASGARILTHLVHQLQQEKLKYGLGAACIGGGQGIAVLLENVSQ